MDSEDLVVEVLNSTPTVDGHRTDALRDDARAGRDLARRWGGIGSDAEIDDLVRVRDAVQQLVAEGRADDDLSDLLAAVQRRPALGPNGLRWKLDTSDDQRLPLAFLEAWSDVEKRLPSRLRTCQNDECSLFLLDRSRGNAARWCSMATCGNRMKARRHHERSRSAARAHDGD